MDRCPLCKSSALPITGASAELKIVDAIERYFRCENCSAVFVPERFHLTAAEECERYGLHDNSDSNEGYRKYLFGVAESIRKLVPDMEERSLLDYGAGEDAVLTKILNEKNINCVAYDPNYGELSNITGTYDLIIACESVEHFRAPYEEFALINTLLNKGAFCYIRTEMLESTPYFAGWWYKNDLTHIFFYAEKTMNYLADEFNWELVSCDRKNSILFRKR